MSLKSNFSAVENSAMFKKVRAHRWECSQRQTSGFLAAQRYEKALANINGMIEAARNPEMNTQKVILARKMKGNNFKIIGHGVTVVGFDEVKKFAKSIGYTRVRFLSNVIPV